MFCLEITIDKKEGDVTLLNSFDIDITYDLIISNENEQEIFFDGWFWIPKYGYQIIQIPRQLNCDFLIKILKDNKIILKKTIFSEEKITIYSNELEIFGKQIESVIDLEGIYTRKKNEIEISVNLPSRKRISNLDKTLNSIISLSDMDNPNFEIVVKVDFDDTETIDYIKNLNKKYENITFVINSRKLGWLSMVDFVENMIDISKGKWILGTNDDVEFKTKNWNTLLCSQLKEFKIYFINTNGYMASFPVFPKKIKDILGHISPHNQIDTYLYNLSLNTGIDNYIENVYIEHDLDLHDEIYHDKMKVNTINFNYRDYHYTSTFFKNDIKKMREYLKLPPLVFEPIYVTAGYYP